MTKLTDEDIERYAREIVGKRGKYRYAYTEERAVKIVMDVLLDFRDAAGRSALAEDQS